MPRGNQRITLPKKTFVTNNDYPLFSFRGIGTFIYYAAFVAVFMIGFGFLGFHKGTKYGEKEQFNEESSEFLFARTFMLFAIAAVANAGPYVAYALKVLLFFVGEKALGACSRKRGYTEVSGLIPTGTRTSTGEPVHTSYTSNTQIRDDEEGEEIRIAITDEGSPEQRIIYREHPVIRSLKNTGFSLFYSLIGAYLAVAESAMGSNSQFPLGLPKSWTKALDNSSQARDEYVDIPAAFAIGINVIIFMFMVLRLEWKGYYIKQEETEDIKVGKTPRIWGVDRVLELPNDIYQSIRSCLE